MKQLFLLCCFVLLSCSLSSARDYYVATDGNDGNPGTIEKPFATLEKARDTIRQSKARALAPGGGKGIINSQKAVGGWPTLKSAPAPADSDHDGMSDDWELAHGLDPKNPSDGPQDRDSEGYTHVEEYLNSLVPPIYGDTRATASRLCRNRAPEIAALRSQ